MTVPVSSLSHRMGRVADFRTTTCRSSYWSIVHLEEHTEVEGLIPTAASADTEDPTGWKAAEALIGFIERAPPDMVERHDLWLKN